MLRNNIDLQIVCLEPFVYRGVDFQKSLPGIPVFSPDDLRIVEKQVICLLVGLEFLIDDSYLKKYPNLEVVASATTGVDHVVLPESIEILKLESSEVEDISATSEFTFGLLLSLVRKIPLALTCGSCRESLQGRQIRGKTLGIIGFGRLGRNMARYAEAFLMNVLTFDKTDNEAKLEQLLEKSDIISVHLPLSEETVGFIGMNEFLKMRKKPFVVNTSRPAIIDKEALLVAVKKEYISGIAMDFQNYDCSNSFDPELYSLPKDRTIFTQHIAGNTVESVRCAATIITQKLAVFLGVPLFETFPSYHNVRKKVASEKLLSGNERNKETEE